MNREINNVFLDGVLDHFKLFYTQPVITRKRCILAPRVEALADIHFWV
jgi:hypothetical protein